MSKHTKVISMSTKQNYMDIARTKRMFHNFAKIAFDPAGIMGATGTLLLGITTIFEDIPTEYPGLAGAALVLVSVYQKVSQTRRDNEKAKRQQELYAERHRILKMVEEGKMEIDRADFMLRYLDED